MAKNEHDHNKPKKFVLHFYDKKAYQNTQVSLCELPEVNNTRKIQPLHFKVLIQAMYYSQTMYQAQRSYSDHRVCPQFFFNHLGLLAHDLHPPIDRGPCDFSARG